MGRLGLVVAAVTGLGCGARPLPAAAVRVSRAPALVSPARVDVGSRGAPYLTVVGHQLQPRWSQFLEDCRLRLPPDHPLNRPALVATVALAIDRRGRVLARAVTTSGNPDYDRAVADVLAEVPQLEPPPVELLSDDDRLHLRWEFARDLRQAGPATAEVVIVEQPLGGVIERLVGQGELPRAARRILAAPATDPDRLATTDRVMIAALREALGSAGTSSQAAAVEAIGRSGVRTLATDVRALLSPTVDTELRLAAITALGRLADQASADRIAAQLPADLPDHPKLALAETATLVALGQGERAAAAIRRVLEADLATPLVGALHAHGLAPSPALAPWLVTWFARGDARTRAAVCVAIPRAAPAPTVIRRGLRDPDATVRATCADAAARQRGSAIDAATMRRLRELRRDRDQLVRARAIAALAVLEPGRVAGAATDPAPEVRTAAVTHATEPELLALAGDRDPDVRAAAVATLGARGDARGRDVAVRAASDAAAQVRRAAIASLTDQDLLERLATDPSLEVATAALAQIITRRGRAAMIDPMLDRLAAAPRASADRVRIAVAWLTAPAG